MSWLANSAYVGEISPAPGMRTAAALQAVAWRRISRRSSSPLARATAAALTDDAHRSYAGARNPHAALIAKLQEAGATVVVCGQSLRQKNYPREGVLEGIRVVAAAMTTIIDEQRAGAALLVY